MYYIVDTILYYEHFFNIYENYNNYYTYVILVVSI